MAVESIANGLVFTTLAGGITTNTTILVSTAAGFPTSGNFRIRCQNEIMIVTGGQGTTTWTVTRGAEGTTQVSHAASTPIVFTVTEQSLKNLFREEQFISGTNGVKPTDSRDNSIFVPNTAQQKTLSLRNGGVWEEYSYCTPRTPQLFGSPFSFVGSATGVTTSTANGTFALTCPAGTGADNWRCYLKTMPTKPFQIQCCFTVYAKPENFWTAGLIVRDSSSGKFGSYGFTFRDTTGGLSLECVRWNSLTSFNSLLDTTRKYWMFNTRLMWLQLRITSSIIGADWSPNNVTYGQWHSEGLTDFIPTPDQIGIGVSCTNSEAATIKVHSWSVF
jgi:hypothetical protein